MGVSGVDVLLSPAARKVFGLGAFPVEAKNVESLNVATTFYEHEAKYPGEFAVLIHTKNRKEPLITMTFASFKRLLNKWVETK